MKLTTLAGVLLAVLVVTGSAAALPAAAGAQATDHANDDADGARTADHANETHATDHANESDAHSNAASADEAGPAHEASERQGPPADAGPNGERGPPTDMPANVPDFVSEIHGLIQDHIAGDLGSRLGSMISDLTPGGETADHEPASANNATQSEQ